MGNHPAIKGPEATGRENNKNQEQNQKLPHTPTKGLKL
jgi:hypothetical protein